jgi:hypothetical protein
MALLQLYHKFTLRLQPGQVPLETIHILHLTPKNGVLVTVHARQHTV